MCYYIKRQKNSDADKRKIFASNKNAKNMNIPKKLEKLIKK